MSFLNCLKGKDMKFSKRFGGFTMLELLAVLAIVLILSAIIFPAIESAREKSLSTACSQNVKQLILGVSLYEQDKGNFPPGRQFFNATGVGFVATDMVKWSNAISPYMHASPNAVTGMGGQASILAATAVANNLGSRPPGDADNLYVDAYRCPAVSNWDLAGLNMSYGYNYQYLGNADPVNLINAAGAATGFVNFPVSKGAIQRPDLTICVADSDGTGQGAYQTAANTTNTPPAGTALGAFAYLLDPTFLPVRELGGGVAAITGPGFAGANMGPAAGGLTWGGAGSVITLTAAPIAQSARSAVSNRHKGSANVGFLDGHVETLIREECYMAGSTSTAALPVVNGLYLSNARWNGFGIDNDLNGDGVVTLAQGERIVDTNEAFLLVAAGPGTATLGVAPNNFVSAVYRPAGAGGAPTGFGVFTGLLGNYGQYGTGFNPNAAFLATGTGPTLPRVAPFDVNADQAAVR